jgi:hypothetical protein
MSDMKKIVRSRPPTPFPKRRIFAPNTLPKHTPTVADLIKLQSKDADVLTIKYVGYGILFVCSQIASGEMTADELLFHISQSLLELNSCQVFSNTQLVAETSITCLQDIDTVFKEWFCDVPR